MSYESIMNLFKYDAPDQWGFHSTFRHRARSGPLLCTRCFAFWLWRGATQVQWVFEAE